MAHERVREIELLRLLDAVYEAAFEPARWGHVVDAARALHGAHAGKVGAIDFETGKAWTLALRGVDPELHAEWETRYAEQDDWAREGLTRLRAGVARTATGRELMDHADLVRSIVYNDILSRAEVEDCVSTGLRWSGSTVGFLGIYRRKADGPFEPADRELHDWIGHHARRAFALGEVVQRERQQSRSLVERFPCAAMLCERDGRIVLHNTKAESLLREGIGLFSRSNRLRARDPGSGRMLARALDLATQSAAGKSLAGGSTLRVVRETGQERLVVIVDPIPVGSVAADTMLAAFSEPIALVLVSDPESRTILPAEALAAAFDLTPTEARMLAALSSGETPAEYAERNQISRETARFHVKRLLAKTGARRQADLVRIALESVVRLTRQA